MRKIWVNLVKFVKCETQNKLIPKSNFYVYLFCLTVCIGNLLYCLIIGANLAASLSFIIGGLYWLTLKTEKEHIDTIDKFYDACEVIKHSKEFIENQHNYIIALKNQIETLQNNIIINRNNIKDGTTI